MLKFITSIGAVICLGLLACNGAKEKPKPSPPTVTATPPPKAIRDLGILIPAEPVANSTDGATYALYLPKAYSHDSPAPLVLFFDSHARGKDPLKLYQALADQYHTILVGSNVSRNGQQPQQSLQIYDALVKDVRAKFSVDEKRITACGFSGGARVAAMLAQNRREVSSVIACSAGFQPARDDHFNYYAIIGWEDFNLGELQLLNELLDKKPQPHVVAYWDGGHEWPPIEVMQEAFDFVRFRHLDAGDVAKDSLVAAALQRFEAGKRGLKSGSLALWRLYTGLVAKLEGHADLTKVKTEMTAIEQGERWADDKAREEDASGQEMVLRELYVPWIASKSVGEWEIVAPELRKNDGVQTKEMDRAILRVMNFLSLNTYFQVDAALKAGDLARTEHFLQIYALVDPENPEHAYLTAVVRMRQNKPDDAIKSLEAAQRLGFKDADRMEVEPDLAKLKGTERFMKLADQMRKAD
jgi:predicted esterase